MTGNDVGPERSPVSELRCARTREEVDASWRLVHDVYVARGIIAGNRERIHRVPGAIGPHACVIYRATPAAVVSTLTAIRDSECGLPLDRVVGDCLDLLRAQGRCLVETGMLADRRVATKRSVCAVFDLMRWALYFAVQQGADDIVIGVHPRHVGFYVRAFRMQILSPIRQYADLRQSPVVLMRCPLREQLRDGRALPRGLAFAMKHPVEADAFVHRYRFRTHAVPPPDGIGRTLAGGTRSPCRDVPGPALPVPGFCLGSA